MGHTYRVIRQRRRVLRMMLIALFLALLAPAGARADASLQGKYLLDFYPIRTPLGSSNLNLDQAKKLAQGVNFAYREISGEKFKFDFGVLASEITSEKLIKVPRDVDDLIAAIRRDKVEGYVKVISVGVIPKDDGIKFAGIATLGGKTTLINGLSDSIGTTIDVLNHEIGHNLGLNHSNSMVCTDIAAGPVQCEPYEYGDRFDTMGSYPNYFRSEIYLRLSAFNLDYLGLLDETSKVFVYQYSEIELDGLYSGSGKFPRVAFLPILNSLGYSIEYRPAVKVDEKMDDTRIDVPDRPGYYWSPTPNFGLIVRVMGLKGETKDYLPQIKDLDDGDSYLYAPSQNGRQGFDPGYSQKLSDGSVITFLSASADGKAKVRITRPKDTKAPTLGEMRISSENQTFYNNEIKLKKGENGRLVPAVLNISPTSLKDDFGVSSMSLVVDGAVTKNITGFISSTKTFEHTITNYGDYTFQVTARDGSGNEAQTAKQTISVKEFKYDQPWVEFEDVKDPKTSIRFTVSADSSDSESLEYSLTSLSDGEITSKEILGDKITFTVEKLKRNSTFKAQVSYRDRFGNESETESIETEVESSECDSKECYVGVEWNASGLYWKTKVAAIQLQQKVGKKWKTIATAPTIASKNGPSGYIYTHDLKWVHSKAGKYTFRLYIPGSKKVGAWSSGEFVQTVIP